jgi:choline dehydrogenase
MTYTTPRGRRESTETAYLTPVLARPNLYVATHATVTRVLLDKSPDGTIRATGVEFTASADGRRYQARASKEVILS